MMLGIYTQHHTSVAIWSAFGVKLYLAILQYIVKLYIANDLKTVNY
jgi:hypothetical protein